LLTSYMYDHFLVRNPFDFAFVVWDELYAYH